MRIDNRDIPKGSKVKWNFLAAEDSKQNRDTGDGNQRD